ncbi:odorant receptor Or1-like [Tenebrio molitor]|jgi:hypothetical protein|uniref:odorant receptor Or1-like n=1 Tax=Tenebrio molitor TaxID=7067 RepID=UPI003624A769
MDEHLLLEELDVSDFIKLNIKCIHFLSYFPLDDEKSLFKRTCQLIYGILFVGFVYALCVSSEIVNMLVVFGDIEKMTEASFVLLTNLSHSLKLYVFIKHGSEIRNLIKSINREEFKPRNLVQYKMLVKDIKMSKLLTKIFLFMCCVTCLLWAVFPLLDRKSGERIRLPLSGWYPFKIDKPPVFELIYAYQIFATCINGLRNISMDTFLSGSIMVIAGQLGILNNSLQIMGQYYKNKMTDEDQGNQEKFRKILVRNVIHYKNIIQ